MNWLLKFATHPLYPMVASALLYLLMCWGWVTQGRPWFGATWALYAAATACFYMDSLR